VKLYEYNPSIGNRNCRVRYIYMSAANYEEEDIDNKIINEERE
jgi:hypothetical protein